MISYLATVSFSLYMFGAIYSELCELLSIQQLRTYSSSFSLDNSNLHVFNLNPYQ